MEKIRRLGPSHRDFSNPKEEIIPAEAAGADPSKVFIGEQGMKAGCRPRLYCVRSPPKTVDPTEPMNLPLPIGLMLRARGGGPVPCA